MSIHSEQRYELNQVPFNKKKSMTTLSRQDLMSLAAICLLGMTAALVQPEPTERQKEVTEQGAKVMPFNVHNSTHVFVKTADGGMQQVVAKDGSNKGLIAAIRMHFITEADRLKRGNYADP